MKNINNSIKKILIVVFFITFYSCVDVKPDIKIDRIIDLHIDGENVDGLSLLKKMVMSLPLKLKKKNY